MPPIMSTPFFAMSPLVDLVAPKPALPAQPPLQRTLPPEMFRPQRQTPPGLPPNWQTAVPKPPGFMESPGGFDPSKRIPGNISYGGPQLNTEAALSSLAGASPSPLLDIQRAMGQMAPGGGAFRGGRDEQAAAPFGQFVSEQLAPGRSRTESITGALQAQHPAVRALAATEAAQKAMPAQATAAGMIGAAETSADASLQRAMIEAMQGQRQEAAESMGPIWNFLSDLNLSGYDFEQLSPEVQQLIQRAIGALGQYNTAAGF